MEIDSKFKKDYSGLIDRGLDIWETACVLVEDIRIEIVDEEHKEAPRFVS